MNELENRIIRLGAVVLTWGGLYFGIDQGPRAVYADTPTPTPTPTATITPDALGTQIVGARATEIALIEKNRQEKELAEIQERINALLGTPTVTPTPNATARAEATVDASVAQRRAAIQATATADAIRSFTPTSTPRPRLPEIIPTPEKPGGGENQRGGDLPWWVLFGIPVAFGGGFGWARRQQIIDRIRQGINRVRNRFGGGGAVGGGAGGAPGAGGLPAVP